MECTFVINGEEVKVQDYKLTQKSVSFSLNGLKHYYMLVDREGEEMILDHGGRFRVNVSSPGTQGERMVIANGIEAQVLKKKSKTKKTLQEGKGALSPMPGKIFKILKQVGDEVKKGETILILEAMKMEHSIRSDRDGVVKKIYYQTGQMVLGGVILSEVE